MMVMRWGPNVQMESRLPETEPDDFDDRWLVVLIALNGFFGGAIVGLFLYSFIG
jgi:uncharacterized membrane protein YoaK (UPF0700 family)